MTQPARGGRGCPHPTLASSSAVRVNRERLIRHLTFWLRPAFVRRCLQRFAAVDGFDRAIALSSLALTALVPLGIVASGVLSSATAGTKIVDRFGLRGHGAQAVEELFSSGTDPQTGVSVLCVFLLLVATLSFARAVQRLFERAWELAPLSVRNTRNDLLWIVGFVAFAAGAGFVRSALADGALGLLTGAAVAAAIAPFTIWSGRVLTDRRVTWRQLLPGAVLVAVLFAAYGAGSDIYVPRLFNTYASRYGAIGVVFAMMSWLFGLMVALVAAATAGREVWTELEAIRRGHHSTPDSVGAEWAAVRAQLEQGRAEVAARTRTVLERIRRGG